MACKIKLSDLNEDQANLISTMLSFVANKQNSKYKYNSEPPIPFKFYDIRNQYAYLPFTYGNILKGRIINNDIDYIKTNWKFTGELREYQKPVEQEALNQLQTYNCTTLGLYPGFGKTILGIKLASYFDMITLILTHREILNTQWNETVLKFSDAKVWIVGEKHPPPSCNIIICMDTRYNLISEELRRKIGFLIIDEAHAFCTPGRVNCLLAFEPKYILIESASLERDDGLHNMMYAIVGTHGVLRESNKPFKVIKLLTNTAPERKLNRLGGIDWISLNKKTLLNDRRNRIIIEIIKSNLNLKPLILTSLVDHALLLYEMLKTNNINCDYLCGNKKNYVDSSVLVGTISKIGTGFDPATFCQTYDGRPFDLLLLVCSIKKYDMLVQNIGRVFRADYPTVIHFVDNDPIYKNHWTKSLKWYIARGGIITEHNIPNTEEPEPSHNADDPIKQHQRQLSWISAKLASKK